ncbi:MAG: ECF transporter S component [Clostridia bacterium]|nr:ECF transporter S component [Clostridia bacterium]
MNSRVKRMVLLAMFAAVAYVVMFVGRLPISTVDFLKYDPKDVVLAICGFLCGPAAAFIVTLVVSLIEMITVSSTGIIGLIMNVISSAAFACTAAFTYKKKHTLSGAVGGLAAGGTAMVAVMLAWNYLITPFYMDVPREQIAAILIPVFLPFNLIKSIINAAITLIIYKPVSKALHKAGIIGSEEHQSVGKINLAVLVVSVLLLATCVFVVLAMKEII